MKSNNDYFADWESHVFGYGYGSGEPNVIPLLRRFLGLMPEGNYDYAKLEEIGPEQAWLLINTLCHADIIEYGTSPRFGWLTEQGKSLRDFVLSKTPDELIEMTNKDQDYLMCYPDHCNCDNGKCNNPFWKSRVFI